MIEVVPAELPMKVAKPAKAAKKEEAKVAAPSPPKKAPAAVEKSFVMLPKRGSSAYIFFNNETVLRLKESGVEHREAFV